MASFFYSDSSKAEKISLLAMLSLLGGLFFFWFFVDFRATNSFSWLAAQIALFLTPAIAIAAWLAPPIRVPKRSSLKNILIWIVLSPLLWAGLYILVLKGAGSISLITSGNVEYRTATVIGKSSGLYKRRKCDHSVSFRAVDKPYAIYTKCVRKDLWRQLESEDSVSFVIHRSRLGYSTSKVVQL